MEKAITENYNEMFHTNYDIIIEERDLQDYLGRYQDLRDGGETFIAGVNDVDGTDRRYLKSIRQGVAYGNTYELKACMAQQWLERAYLQETMRKCILCGTTFLSGRSDCETA